MRAVHLAIRLTVYYLAVSGLVLAATLIFPGARDYLPIGGAAELLTGASHDLFSSIEIGAAGVTNLQESVLWLVIAVAGAILTVIPLSWTYMAVRANDDYDQSLVETIMVLPIAVTSIVIIVNQSVALAFGLAGIVGGVRFRNTLKSSGDALYILTAIGIGLAAGIGALEIALVMTVAFNYCFLILWILDYGAKKGARRYMRKAMKNGEKDVEGGKKKKARTDAEPATPADAVKAPPTGAAPEAP